MRERGLKRVRSPDPCKIYLVAPHAGAWIETGSLAGTIKIFNRSLPMRERGLKPSSVAMPVSPQPCRSPCGSVD